MGFLKKLFSSSKQEVTQTEAPARPSPNPPQGPETIRVFDQFGRELAVPREEWRTNVLPNAIRDAWDNADKLSSVISQALRDGFAADLQSAGERLAAIDTDPVRRAVLFAIVLRENGRRDEARALYRAYNEQHGDHPLVLANEGQLLAQDRRFDEAELILWKALTLDPNQEHALGWYRWMHREIGGTKAEFQALGRVDALPNSWRAKLWLARRELDDGNSEKALGMYRRMLEPVVLPADLLMQVSGDLGQHGLVSEMIALVRPRFSPKEHGIMVGNNVLKGLIETSQFEDARKILASLYAENRPDWRETLDYWERTLDEVSGRFGAVPLNELKLEGGILSGPLWARSEEKFDRLVPTKSSASRKVSVVLASVATPPDMARLAGTRQKTDLLGGLSRAVSLHIADALYMQSPFEAAALVPRVRAPNGDTGAVVIPKWEDADVVRLAGEISEGQCVLNTHLDASTDKWVYSVRILDGKTGALIAADEEPLDPNDPERFARAILPRIVRVLGGEYVEQSSFPVPAGERFKYYLVVLEQTLAVVMAAQSGRNTLYGERAIFDGLLHYCLGDPADERGRLLLLTALNRHRQLGSPLYKEYVERVRLLVEKSTLRAEIRAAIDALLDTFVAAATAAV